MRVPLNLSEAFRDEFARRISQFSVEHGLLPDEASLESERFIARSIVPHVQRLSRMFNRLEGDADVSVPVPAKVREAKHREGLDPYWKESSNPKNARLAYFLYFMPSNAFRVASIFAELERLGFRWKAGETLRAIEWGAGPASGAAGTALASKLAPGLGWPEARNFALIEQDRQTLQLGEAWLASYSEFVGAPWTARPFHRKVDWEKAHAGAVPLLPRSAPTFQLWLSSYFLNESPLDAEAMADVLVEHWERHLEEEGIAVLVEPALRLQSRRLLELRRALLARFEAGKTRRGEKIAQYRVLLPCLGHQACGALAAEKDWCHEEVTWWRPPYFRRIDEMAGLDRKTLPFSYLVVAKSKRAQTELLPDLAAAGAAHWERLVSPAHAEGQDLEFFHCGPEGKRRARYRPRDDAERAEIDRGSILVEPEVRGDVKAGRIERLKGVL